jgi:hypothetical protein
MWSGVGTTILCGGVDDWWSVVFLEVCAGCLLAYKYARTHPSKESIRQAIMWYLFLRSEPLLLAQTLQLWGTLVGEFPVYFKMIIYCIVSLIFSTYVDMIVGTCPTRFENAVSMYGILDHVGCKNA